MNEEKIRIRRTCCQLLGKTGMQTVLTKRCDEQVLLEGCQKVLESEIAQNIKHLSADMQKRLMETPELLGYVLGLLQKGPSPRRVETLLKQIKMEELLNYNKERVAFILMNQGVADEHLLVYLRYYLDLNLSWDQQTLLKDGLRNYFSRRQNQEETFFIKNRKIFYSKVVASKLLNKISDYDSCLSDIANNYEIYGTLNEILKIDGDRQAIDDENFQQIKKQPRIIRGLLQWADRFFEDEEKPSFMKLLLGNHSLAYDLQHLKDKVENGMEEEAHQMIENRASYIAFFYNDEFIEEWEGKCREDLVIYAITHRKKAFLSLIKENKELFLSIPLNSILFQREFYDRVLNLNTINNRNLKQCLQMKQWPTVSLERFYDKGSTFEEIQVLSGMPERYAELYLALSIPRVDGRLKVIREVINRKCLKIGMEILPLAEQLSVQPFSVWMQKTFSHIKGLDNIVGMRLLEHYEQMQCLIEKIETVAEARYICKNIKLFQGERDICIIRDQILDKNEDWQNLKEAFGFSEEFIRDNEARIKEFIYKDGAYIMGTYLKNVPEKKEALRRLVYAELMDRFRELKYFRDDLALELDYQISESSKSRWMENINEENGRLRVWEEDGLLPVMQMGQVPEATCLSYVDGVYKQCLLACHDANKKVVYLSLDGNIVLRAAIRLTKGVYGSVEKNNLPQLEFADLSAPVIQQRKEEKQEEILILFLETAYMSKLPQNMAKPAIEMLLQLVKKKARLMGVQFAASLSYAQWRPKDMVRMSISMYISRSKAGEQYLDSIGGDNRIEHEGSYRKYAFLVESK
jgi:hypothetical protein